MSIQANVKSTRIKNLIDFSLFTKSQNNNDMFFGAFEGGELRD